MFTWRTARDRSAAHHFTAPSSSLRCRWTLGTQLTTPGTGSADHSAPGPGDVYYEGDSLGHPGTAWDNLGQQLRRPHSDGLTHLIIQYLRSGCQCTHHKLSYITNNNDERLSILLCKLHHCLLIRSIVPNLATNKSKDSHTFAVLCNLAIQLKNLDAKNIKA